MLNSAYGNARSGGEDGEGDDLRIVGWGSVQGRADRRAAWQRAEIQGNLAGGAGGDLLPVALDGEDRGWLIHAMALIGVLVVVRCKPNADRSAPRLACAGLYASCKDTDEADARLRVRRHIGRDISGGGYRQRIG